MNKVVKLFLITEQTDKDGNTVDHSDIYHMLWELQKQTREIKNKTVQLCWEWNNFSSDYAKAHGEYPKEKDILDYTLNGFVYDHFKKGYDIYSANISSSTQDVCAAFKNARKEILRGDRAILSYKSNQPLDLHKKSITLDYNNGTFYVTLKLLNRSGAEKYNTGGSSVKFKVQVYDNSTKTILERCIDGVYEISGSKLIYVQKKKQWRLNLCYAFKGKAVEGLDKERILGVDLGVAYPICASVYGDLSRFTIEKGEIEDFRKRVEARKRSLLRQGPVCGNGRIGHGIHTRNKPVYKIEDKIARFRDTVNHKYSRALVDFAIKNRCGIIQMEDLTGITAEADRFLKNWSYFDLQTKIENKAKEAGIEVIYIKPRYTSQRCSKCGFIHKDNRPTQSDFLCQKCGFKENADYNASQNIAIRDIDKIIEESAKAKET